MKPDMSLAAFGFPGYAPQSGAYGGLPNMQHKIGWPR
jgi:hypothetical protein